MKKRVFKKWIPVLAVLCLAAGLLAGCGGSSAGAGKSTASGVEADGGSTQAESTGDSKEVSAGQKTMVIGDTTFNAENWEETVDPHRTYNGWACIRYGIGETLVHYTDTMELEPWLAKSWENDGNLTWTITLQDDVYFSSGRWSICSPIMTGLRETQRSRIFRQTARSLRSPPASPTRR